MIEGIPRISVLIICYKQEELIKRAINSLLAQKDYIYEICVSDDCSPDRTWEVLQEYDRQYPGLFKLHRNEPNVGIFENFEQVWTMPTGDVVYTLAGDDECGEGWFKTVISYIQENNIEWRNELFTIYGDYQCNYPNGDSFVYKNSLAGKGYNLMSLSLRGEIGNRSAICSIKIVQKYFKCSQGRSYIAESAQDRQLPMFTEKAYYIPMVGNIYYTQIGVNATVMKGNKSVTDDIKRIDAYVRDIFEAHGYSFNKKDLLFFKYKEVSSSLLDSWSLTGWIRLCRYKIKSAYPALFRFRQFKRFAFAIMRRLPHKTPLNWSI